MRTKAMENADQLMTVKEVAQTLRLSERTVWRFADSGQLPRPVALGGSRRWRRSDIDAVMRCGCGKARAVARS
ncbi:MAG TPA: helix-turn-helix domain-containing protein [Candidatus Hydrogenedentes bacterium]|nr:helix-turn-helix domain-containing protein [Candidatus Hydrogenedentota bacterium]